MIVFPNCKINIGLNIIGKRTDGYHNLETVFYPLPLYDVLEVIQHTNAGQSCELFLSGVRVEGSAEDNLCVKAYYLLKKDHPQLPPVKIYLHKTIPAGAGLGGGSSDGAFTLGLLNDKFQLHLSNEKLLSYALELGSDCPFFIFNKPCFAQQRGEVLEPLPLSLRGYKLVLVNPGIHVSTGWAFSQVNYSANDLKNRIGKPVEQWHELISNNFEGPVFKRFPGIAAIKHQLYASGALFASMSGTGSTVYGIFPGNTAIDKRHFLPHYFVKQLEL
ncbi:MAG TPA: 4-(cytidine 5'-diphospho)-2-C-methyl-D-erythritol kinase [Parafilimonas sp.]|nr:4-(cytidine 5'-diphospho)-2-C-methyl-D-erythritol kinase [Parafilimonas sp.]